jgi:molecular chaperone DnaK (HSP70)
MSVVGIDLGAQSTKIGVARNKGIDIVSISTQDMIVLALTFS